MQIPVAFVSFSLLLSAAAPAPAQVAPTPNEADIPRPVPIAADLAGAERPDISRFLNVRSASNPSLSPDGSQLAFESSVTGKPQLWVVDAAGGWPRQLTLGESVTFNQWSPTGEWILYGSDRGGNEREGFYLINATAGRCVDLEPRERRDGSRHALVDGGPRSVPACGAGSLRLAGARW